MKQPISYIAFSFVFLLLGACADDRSDTTEPDTTSEPEVVPVTLENYKFAESDLAFANVTQYVGTSQFLHFPVDALNVPPKHSHSSSSES